MALNGRQRSHLRSLAHHKKPVVIVGKSGITDEVIAATAQGLLDHELIKVKLAEVESSDRKTVAEQLAKRTHSELCQIKGNIVLLYKRHPDEPTITFPR